MSDVTTINILTWSGMSTVAHRNVVIADLLPEPDGIANLVDCEGRTSIFLSCVDIDNLCVM